VGGGVGGMGGVGVGGGSSGLGVLGLRRVGGEGGGGGGKGGGGADSNYGLSRDLCVVAYEEEDTCVSCDSDYGLSRDLYPRYPSAALVQRSPSHESSSLVTLHPIFHPKP